MYLILDFDSTIIQTESLDVLAEICNCSIAIQSEIRRITNLGMQGDISMHESLRRRFQLLNASIDDIPLLTERLAQNISPSIYALKNLSKIFPDKCYVVSSGFMEYILPICSKIGFKENQIVANEFIVSNNKIVDFRKDLAISEDRAKVKVVNNLQLKEYICMIGDGYTDLEVKLFGEADFFIAFTESVYRENVVNQSDIECKSFLEVVNCLNSLHEH